jgi:hypothetical protein
VRLLLALAPLIGSLTTARDAERAQTTLLREDEQGRLRQIVSLSPCASHFLFQLGALDRVIAVAPASAALPAHRTVDIVSPDAVSALEPEMVFCPTGDAGRRNGGMARTRC